MKFLKFLPAAAAVIISAGALCFSAYADETVVTQEVTEAITEETIPEVSEPAQTTAAETTVSTDITEEPQTSESEALSESADGWSLQNNRWFYYIDGAPANGIVEIDGESYLLHLTAL